jgi:hypothetical protein
MDFSVVIPWLLYLFLGRQLKAWRVKVIQVLCILYNTIKFYKSWILSYAFKMHVLLKLMTDLGYWLILVTCFILHPHSHLESLLPLSHYSQHILTHNYLHHLSRHHPQLLHATLLWHPLASSATRDPGEQKVRYVLSHIFRISSLEAQFSMPLTLAAVTPHLFFPIFFHAALTFGLRCGWHYAQIPLTHYRYTVIT